jgi:hypothetical protein
MPSFLKILVLNSLENGSFPPGIENIILPMLSGIAKAVNIDQKYLKQT